MSGNFFFICSPFKRAILLFSCLLLPYLVQAQYSEYQIKGAMVYNFAKYITWPKKIFGNKKMIVAVLGDNPFGEDLEKIVANRKANDRFIEIRYGRTIKDIKGSHVVFFSRSEDQASIESVLESYNAKFILTIGDDIEDFCELGGIINLSFKQKKPSFSINLEAAQKAGLIIDAKLLQLAEEFIGYEHTKQ
ncbi:MAG: YfiR family protein [Bacteroidota bacterium]